MLKLWNFTIARVKTVFKNYNVIERAEKALEIKKRAPPRHPGTEVKFQVLIKDNPGIKEDIGKRDADLLNRLKIVKVTSQEVAQTSGESKKPLPQERMLPEDFQYGYPEPKFIPEGKCTMKQALEFIANHQNDPTTHSVESITKTYSLKQSDVENIIEYFKAFELYMSRESKKDVSKVVLSNLGVNKVIRPVFDKKFAHLEQKHLAVTVESNEKK